MDKNLIIEIFHNNEQRYTKARDEMISIFLDNPTKHFTIEEIINILSEKDNVNVGTVYNNINIFLELNIIKELVFNSKKYYELINNKHGHFYCNYCCKLFDVEIPIFSCIGIQIENKYGAKTETNSIEFRGKCLTCVKRENG